MKFSKVILLLLFLVPLEFVNGAQEGSIFEQLTNTIWKHLVASRFIVNLGRGVIKVDSDDDLLPDTGEYVRTPLEIREDYHAAFGSRISETKCQYYKTKYEFESLIEDAKKRPLPSPIVAKRPEPGVFTIQAIGRNATAEEFPHVGALGWRAVTGDWKFKCGCSLISPNFVLTAAHCSWLPKKYFNLLNSRPQIVRLGTKDILANRSKYSTDVSIRRIIVHPEYHSVKKYNDIALMELKYRLTFNMDMQPACVWVDPEVIYPSQKIFSTGWEFSDGYVKRNSSLLQAVEVDIINSTKCEEIFKASWDGNFKSIPDLPKSHQICAAVLKGVVDPCQDDSGGPIQVKITSPLSTRDAGMSYLLGVLSYGYGCARPGIPIIYSRVSSYMDWIEDNVWQEELISDVPKKEGDDEE